MNSRPSTSQSREPAPRSIMSGVPPTARNARTGLFTPPTRIFWARENRSEELLTGKSYYGWRERKTKSDHVPRAVEELGPTVRQPQTLALAEPAGDVFGVIGKDCGRAGALDAGHDLKHDALFVNPAVAGGRFHHRIFSTDVIGGDRHVEPLADTDDDVQIRQGGLDHDDVRTFLEVELHFPERFAGIGGIHLVAAAIPELGRRLRGFAERTVKRGAVLGSIRENGDVGEFVFIKLSADGCHAAVHHIGRRDD